MRNHLVMRFFNIQPFRKKVKQLSQLIEMTLVIFLKRNETTKIKGIN